MTTLKIDEAVIYKPINVHITKKVNRNIKYLVIHYTAGTTSKKGTALATRNVFLHRKASADFIVDDTDIVQINPDIENYYCWAVGDGNGKYGVMNNNSINIEICSSLKKGTTYKVPNHNGWYFTDAAETNAIKLAKIIMEKYNIKLENVITHYDASRKACPGLVGWNKGRLYDESSGKVIGTNNTKKWDAFKAKLA